MFIVNSILLEDENGLLTNTSTRVDGSEVYPIDPSQSVLTHHISDHPPVASPPLGDLIDCLVINTLRKGL